MTEYIVIEEQVVYVTTTETSVDVVVQPQTTQAVIQPGAPAIAIKELDGSPSIYPLLELRVPNGTLTDLGGGVGSLTTGGPGGGASALDDLTDVTLTSPANNQLLAYNGSVWVNAANAPAWANVTGTPTTLSGYGITDAASDSELAAHEADTTNIHGIANTANLVLTSDSRLSDARTPTLHASTHAMGGTDPVSPASIGAATASALSTHIGDTSNPHAVTLAQVGGAPVGAKYIVQVADSTLTNEQALGALATGLLKNAATTGVLSTAVGDTDYTLPVTFNAHVGNTTGVHGIADTSQLVLTSDSRLSDARTPTAHHVTHQHGGSDEVATATAAANAIPKAGAGGTLALGFIPSLPSSIIGSGEIPRSPLTTRGDLLTRDASTHARLGVGSVGTFVRSDGTDPSWQLLVAGDIPSLDTSKLATGQLSPARGGTGVNNGTNQLAIPATGTAALLEAANIFVTAQTIRPPSLATTALSIHVPNQIQYILELYNDAYSSSSSAFSYFLRNTGNFSQGTNGATSFALYTNGYSNERLIIDSNGAVLIGGKTTVGGSSLLNHRMAISDSGFSGDYVFGVHADDNNPYLAGFFNDTYSTTVPVAEYFGYNNGRFLMGTHDANPFWLYTGYPNVRIAMDAIGNIGFNTTSEFGGGTGVLGIANATVVPSSNPSGGVVLYAEGGALKARGGSGTITTIAPA